MTPGQGTLGSWNGEEKIRMLDAFESQDLTQTSAAITHGIETEAFSDGEGDPDDDGGPKSQVCPECSSKLEFGKFTHPKSKNPSICIFYARSESWRSKSATSAA